MTHKNDDPNQDSQKPDQIGYKKPPIKTRFATGVSGNPSGRPKGARNKPPKLLGELRDIFLKEAYRKISLKEGDIQVERPLISIAIKSLVANAAKGHTRSQKILFDKVGQIEKEDSSARLEALEIWSRYKREHTAEIERCRRLGRTEPKYLPHPDHVEICVETGNVSFTGPITKEEQEFWVAAIEATAQSKAALQSCHEELEECEEDEHYSDIARDIRFHEFIVERFENAFQTKWQRSVPELDEDEIP